MSNTIQCPQYSHQFEMTEALLKQVSQQAQELEHRLESMRKALIDLRRSLVENEEAGLKSSTHLTGESQAPHAFIACNDGSIPCLVVRKNNSGKLELHGVSKVYGMGHAEYHTRLFQFDEILPFNSCTGVAYAALRQGEKWALLEIRDNGTLHPDWRFLTEFVSRDPLSILQDAGIVIDGCKN